VPATGAVETRLLRGAPQAVIPEAAADADLLLLGSRGHYGPARRLLLGSVATAVARNAPCSTVLVPAE
jgi:nucleotide-binding universal stress UspA family protein